MIGWRVKPMRKIIVRLLQFLILVIVFLVGRASKPDILPTHNEVIDPVVSAAQTEIVEEVKEVKEVKTVTFRVTAYCACSECCGKWAKNRPVDEFGKPIVVGSAGTVLKSGYSCASTLPFGTKIELEGYGTVDVQDRPADWVVNKYGKNIIDIYLGDHQTAMNFGVKYIEGVVK